MRKSGKLLLGVLSVATLCGTGLAAWTINGTYKGTETELTPDVEVTVNSRSFNVVASADATNSTIKFDAPVDMGGEEDLSVAYFVKAEALENSPFDPYAQDWNLVNPKYQPNLTISVEAINKETKEALAETDAFFNYVSLPETTTISAITKDETKGWLDSTYKTEGYRHELEFAWNVEDAEGNKVNPQIAWDQLDRETQQANFADLIETLNYVSFKIHFEVGDASEDPVPPVEEKATVNVLEDVGGTITIADATADNKYDLNKELTVSVSENVGYELVDLYYYTTDEATKTTIVDNKFVVTEATTYTVGAEYRDLSNPIVTTIAEASKDEAYDQKHLYEVEGTIVALGDKINFGRFTIADEEGNQITIYGSRINDAIATSPLSYTNGMWSYDHNFGKDPTPAIRYGNKVKMQIFNQTKNSYKDWYGVILSYEEIDIVPTEIVCDSEEITMTEGTTKKLSITTVPEIINVDLTYLSNNEEIATVGQDGSIKAVKEGETTIDVSYGSVKDTVKVIVNKGPETEAVKLATIDLKQTSAGSVKAADTTTLYNLLNTSLSSDSSISIVDGSTAIVGSNAFYLASGTNSRNIFGPRFGKNDEQSISFKVSSNDTSKTATITRVDISFISWTDSEGEINVNDSSYTGINSEVTLYSFNVDATDTIKIGSKKRSILQEIVLYGEVK